MSTHQGPTAQRRIVAARLRELRAESGESQQEVEAAVGLGRGALTRYEKCVSSMPGPTAEALFRHYSIESSELDELLRLATASRRRGRAPGGHVPAWLQELVTLERDASELHELAGRVIPGLLQTPAYAKAVIERGVSVVSDRINSTVEARVARAAIFGRPEPPQYWAILPESALACRVGNAQTMSDQMRHLLDLAEKPHITIQVLPDSAGAHPSMMSAFLLLRFAIAPQYGVAYTEHLTGGLYLDDPTDVAVYETAYRLAIKAALSDEDSAAMITKYATKDGS